MTSSQISILMNTGSLVLGLCALIFANLAILTPKAVATHRNTLLSFIFCMTSIVLQLCEINNRVSIGDYSAVEDTIRAVLTASVALYFVTIILNVIALMKTKNKLK